MYTVALKKTKGMLSTSVNFLRDDFIMKIQMQKLTDSLQCDIFKSVRRG